jgi:hypothetical protein
MKTYVLDFDGLPALACRAKDDTDAASWTERLSLSRLSTATSLQGAPQQFPSALGGRGEPP